MTTTTPTSIAPETLTGTWVSDPVHSNGIFRVRHFGISWLRGRLREFDVRLERSADGGWNITGSMPTSGIDIGDESLLGHLASADFFDAELHPQLTFASDDVELGADGTLTTRGRLTMRGQSHDVEVSGTVTGPVVDMTGGDRIGLELTLEIDREQWGISWAADLADGTPILGRKVRVAADLELVRA